MHDRHARTNVRSVRLTLKSGSGLRFLTVEKAIVRGDLFIRFRTQNTVAGRASCRAEPPIWRGGGRVRSWARWEHSAS